MEQLCMIKNVQRLLRFSSLVANKQTNKQTWSGDRLALPFWDRNACNLHNPNLREQHLGLPKAKQNTNQTAKQSHSEVFLFFFKIRLLSGGDSRPPRGQRTTSWHLQAKLKFWATQSIKPPTRGGETLQQDVLQAEAKVNFFDLVLELRRGYMNYLTCSRSVSPSPRLFSYCCDSDGFTFQFHFFSY